MELFRALGALVEAPSPEHRPAADALGLGELPSRAEHTDLFGFRLFPYASVYLGDDGMVGGEARDRIAGFWRALDREPPEEPDHLAVLLAAYGDLCARDPGDGPWRRARRAFLWEHLVSWAAIYLPAFQGEEGFYGRWAELLADALQEETEILGPLDREPLCLRRDPGLCDPRGGVSGKTDAEAFLRSLVAPARLGRILTRDDLRRLGADLGLAVRAGERRFVLKHLLGQDAASLLGALVGALTQETLEPSDRWGTVSAAWKRRRDGAKALLEALARSAVEAFSDEAGTRIRR